MANVLVFALSTTMDAIAFIVECWRHWYPRPRCNRDCRQIPDSLTLKFLNKKSKELYLYAQCRNSIVLQFHEHAEGGIGGAKNKKKRKKPTYATESAINQSIISHIDQQIISIINYFLR